jgi:beta-lactam-binding protein with PASTA domain
MGGAWIWLSGLLGLGVLALVAFLVFRLLTGTAVPASAGTVIVPSFVDMSFEQAEIAAAQAGLVLIRDQFDQTSTKPANTVIAQDPAAGATVSRGSEIRLTLAAPAASVLVPDLRNQPESTAVTLIVQAGLAIGDRTEAFDPIVPAGSIISQDPRPLLAVSPQTTINYVVSKGPEPSPTLSPSPTPTLPAAAPPTATLPPADTTPPAPPSTPDLTDDSDTGASSTDNITSDTTPTFRGTAEAGSTVTLFDGATPIGTGVANGGNWTITVSPIESGPHSITAKATDASSNTSAASGALLVTIDTAAPSASFTTPDTGTSESDNGKVSVVWTEAGTGSPVTSRSLQRQKALAEAGNCNNVTWAADGGPDTSDSPVDETGLDDGYCYQWVQTLTDKAGNTASHRSGLVLVKIP